MKENLINILREASNNSAPYTNYRTINETPSQNENTNETNYRYENKQQEIQPNNNLNNSSKIIEPISIITPTLEPDAVPNINYNNTKNGKETNQFIPTKNINQIIDEGPTSNTNCETILSVWRSLFPTIPAGINLLSNYTPTSCCDKKYNFNFTTTLTQQQIAKLIREIYLRMLLSLDTYSLLIRKETALATQRELAALRTQMQVLSSAMLNVYQDYTATNVVPLRNSINSNIPKNLKDAYCYLHDQIFYIYFLLSKLIFNLKNDSNFYGQLVTILNNIKYQLYVLSTFYNNIG